MTGGLKSNFSGSPAFSKTCLGIIHIAFQRTVNSAWKREFGFFSLKTTVLWSGADDVGDVDLDRRAPAQAVGLHVRLDGVDDVVGA